MQRHALQARLEQGEPPAFLETGSSLLQGMVSVKDRENQRLHPMPTGEHLGRMGWDQALEDCGGVEAPYHTQNQGQMGHGLDPLHRHHHEAPPGVVSSPQQAAS